MWELSVWSHMSLEVLAVMATIVYQLEMGLNINCRLLGVVLGNLIILPLVN
jgi:hypothetical protein